MSTESSKTRKIFDGRYEIVSIVGRGAASVVYHGRRATAPYADVAIKVLTDKGASVPAKERLRKEALAMLYARHRYVVRLDDFRAVGDLCYLSMEFAPHRDLRHYITERGNECSAAQRERFFAQAAEALGYVHRAGLIHRDIKADNILVMNEAEIRIADFGVAVLPSDEASLSDLQRGVGTMEYLAPEVLDGVRCDQRSDVYSLGVTFYELLAGQHPFSQAPLAEQLAIRRDGAFTELIQSAPQVPDYINSTIMRCLAFDPAARFENGQQLFEALLLGRDKSKRRNKNRPKAGMQKDSGPDPLSTAENSTAENEADPLGIGNAGDMGTALPSQLAVGELVGGEEDILVERDASRETVLIPKEEVAAARSGEIRNSDRTVSPTVGSPTEQIAGARRETSTKLQALNPERPLSISQSSSSPGSRTSASLGKSGGGNRFSSAGSSPSSFEPDPNPRNTDDTALRSEEREPLRMFKERAATMLELLAMKIEALQADPKTRRYIPIGAVASAFLLGLALFSGQGATPKRLPEEISKPSSIQDPVQPAALSFPKLEPGRYEGRIEGLIPGRTTPLGFIVPAGASSVITLVGLEGWSPILGRYPSGDAPEKLRVSSNGFLIDFTGRVEGDSIVGFFRDLSTGSQGRWEARVAR